MSFELAKKLGLNEYESKAYLSLLESGSVSASRLSNVASIPRARIYDVLVSLEKKGFVEKKPVKPVTYSAVLPSHAVKKAESVHRKAVEDSLRQLSSIAFELEKQVSVSKENFESGEVVLLSGWNNIFSRISEKLENAKNEVVFSTVSVDAIKKKKTFFAKQIAELSDKGVKVKFRRSPSRFVLFDNKSVMLFLNPPNHSNEKENALLLENEFVAKVFSKK